MIHQSDKKEMRMPQSFAPSLLRSYSYNVRVFSAQFLTFMPLVDIQNGRVCMFLARIEITVSADNWTDGSSKVSVWDQVDRDMGVSLPMLFKCACVILRVGQVLACI